MQEPQTPFDDAARVRALRGLCILDSQNEERFDRITRLVCRALDVPISVVSLVDRDRQWFKSKQGLAAQETSRRISFCGHAILHDELMIVPDARLDPRFADNPLVTDPPHIRFYAGHPIRGPGGHRVATLCAIDTRPRELSGEDLRTLADLAAMIERELGLIENSTTDELTGLSNLRGLRAIADQVMDLSRRAGRPATLVDLQLDDFKSLNLRHGQEAGDTLLREFSRLMLETFTEADVIARLKGVEFATLFGALPAANVSASLEALDAAFTKSGLAPRFPELSWSIGIAQFSGEAGQSLDDLLRVADHSMYRARVNKRSFGKGSR